MKTRKIIAGVLALVLTLSMAACGAKKTETPAASQTPAATEDKAPETTAPATEDKATEAPAATDDGCPVLTSTEPVNIIFSHNNSADCAAGKGAQKLADELAARSNGLITVTIYPDGQLGTVPENDQALKEGTIQMMGGVTGSLVGPKLAYFDLPYLVKDETEFKALFGKGTELRDYTEKVYNEMGLQIISFAVGGYANITSNKEIKTYEDFKNLDMRTNGSPIQAQVFTDWGCNVTPVSFGELYIALQQGLVQGQTNNFDTTVTNKLHEVQKYAVVADYSISVSGMYMNKEFYDALPQDVKDLINWVNDNVVEPYVEDLSKQADQAARDEMAAAGVTIVELTDADKEAMRAANGPTYDMIRQMAGDEVIDMIQAAQGK